MVTIPEVTAFRFLLNFLAALLTILSKLSPNFSFPVLVTINEPAAYSLPSIVNGSVEKRTFIFCLSKYPKKVASAILFHFERYAYGFVAPETSPFTVIFSTLFIATVFDKAYAFNPLA